ncbi:MAG: STAS domain-containing protein [Gammaproteobacteria bacterium]|nr:STAS domain-containing protein [Gammaproteobacteria bacterium]MDE2251360.1 STAS domain-containing protein [Gammaproteobacteria bacterium]
MSESATLRGNGDGRYELAGAVTLATVTALRERGLQAFGAGGGPIEVDLGGVARADSGALALLVDWLAWARAAGRELRYTALPASLLALARLSDTEDLLAGR